jgi:hypothetical protein
VCPVTGTKGSANNCVLGERGGVVRAPVLVCLVEGTQAPVCRVPHRSPDDVLKVGVDLEDIGGAHTLAAVL